jgi:hypothetical protein
MEILRDAKDIASVECLPQHLTLAAPECYERLKGYAQMNPPIREQRHQDALWRALNAGIVDVMGSDHAPHTKEEKARPYPASPSGMPGVQTTVPIMLTHVNNGKLSLQRFRRADERWAAACLRPRRQGPDRRGLPCRLHGRGPEAEGNHHRRLVEIEMRLDSRSTASKPPGGPWQPSSVAASSCATARS